MTSDTADHRVTFGLLDTSIGTANLGDQVIVRAVRVALAECGVDIHAALPTHRKWSLEEVKSAAKVDYWIFAGTNMLQSKALRHQPWKMSFRQFRLLRRKVVLFGVGAWQYQRGLSPLMRVFYAELLAKDVLHSVRDEYSLYKLRRIASNVVNTSCPTLWMVLSRGTQLGPAKKVVTTLTDYSKDITQDRILLQLLAESYDEVVLWPQGQGDAAYARSIGFEGTILDPEVEALSRLEAQEFDYVGSRLHGGVLALQQGMRAHIIAVDNRAIEIGKDTGLAVTPRIALTNTSNVLAPTPDLRLPTEAIERFRSELKVLGGLQ